jgi:hypothetical protein
MKLLALTLLAFSAHTITAAQDAPAASQGSADVVAVKFGWSKERIGWERDPFAGPVENFDQMRVRARNEKRIDDLKRSGNQSEVNRAQREARADAAIIAKARGGGKPPRYVFLYKATFQNNGGKVIRSVDWDYVFLDAATGEELGRRQFTGVEKIAPGKRKELEFLVPTPPAQKVSVYALDRRDRDGMKEQFVVVRVVYEDGTVWQPAAPPAP